MNRKLFFDKIRKSIFNGKLSVPQVSNIETILDTWERLLNNPDHRWIANSLAQIYHETGSRMEPVRETFANSDVVVKRRLERAWITGQLPWVKAPYWREGWYGRGYVQVTHKENYRKMQTRTGYLFLDNPDLMLEPAISAEVAVIGMCEGLFTGKKLSDYFSESTDLPEDSRRIINGKDGNDKRIADLHQRFLQAF